MKMMFPVILTFILTLALAACANRGALPTPEAALPSPSQSALASETPEAMPQATPGQAPEASAEPTPEQTPEDSSAEGKEILVITENGDEVVYRLNGTGAAQDLYDQLPFTMDVENFGGNEKIFYPPDELDVSGDSGDSDDLAYYAPWGDVVMFYGPNRPEGGGGLYALGTLVSGSEFVPDMSGEITVERID